eukprot:641549-Prorocentrum_lima.AAC.1
MNQDNRHWVALRHLNGDVWLFDSLHLGPQKLSKEQYLDMLHAHPATFGIKMLADLQELEAQQAGKAALRPHVEDRTVKPREKSCLLYTSDAADDMQW